MYENQVILDNGIAWRVKNISPHSKSNNGKLSDYALIDHNHDDKYSPISHTHGTNFASIDHNHDDRYSLIGHTHTGDFAPANHRHDSTYANINHTHEDRYGNTQNNTKQVYLTGVDGVNIGNIYDNGVYLTTTAGRLHVGSLELDSGIIFI